MSVPYLETQKTIGQMGMIKPAVLCAAEPRLPFFFCVNAEPMLMFRLSFLFNLLSLQKRGQVFYNQDTDQIVRYPGYHPKRFRSQKLLLTAEVQTLKQSYRNNKNHVKGHTFTTKILHEETSSRYLLWTASKQRTSEYPFSLAVFCAFNTYMVIKSVIINNSFRFRSKKHRAHQY